MSVADSETETEDVLASIRRLVSQDAKPVEKAALAEPVAQDQTSAEYLVLTASQRISRRVAEVVAARDAASIPVAPETARSLADELARLESSIAELESAVVPPAVPPQEEAAAPEAEEAPFIDMAEEDAVMLAFPSARQNTEETAPDQPLADAPPVPDEEPADIDALPEPAQAAPLPADPLGNSEETDADPLEETSDSNEAEDLSAQDEPDTQTEAAEEIARPVILRGGAAYDTLPEDDEAPSDHALDIDEDALRGMVARLIREELRGVLGERITSNVRKLVRREIQRVLRDQGQD